MPARLKPMLYVAAGALAALAVTATAAWAGSGVGATFNLGQTNSVDATSILIGTTGGAMLDVRNGSSAAASYGVLGRLTSTSATSNSAGVRGIGLGSAPGVLGSQGAGSGVFGTAVSGSGVRGNSQTGVGVYGAHLSTSGTAAAVEGDTSSTSANASAVYGRVTSTSPGDASAAVRGENDGTAGPGSGVYGSHAGYGWGVYGTSPSGDGVRGSSPNGTGVYGESTTWYAGYFFGNVNVTGTLTKGAGAFKIDHPLHPGSQYLQHSFVESPDMKNVYDGIATTDLRGFATVKLPRYFQALNKTFRYQLTLLGKRAWGAQAIVWTKIHDNRFVIRSKPDVEVSWQVTGIRHDAYANAHRIQVVVPKSGAEQGKYLHPELYGQPASKVIRATAPRPFALSPATKR